MQQKEQGTRVNTECQETYFAVNSQKRSKASNTSMHGLPRRCPKACHKHHQTPLTMMVPRMKETHAIGMAEDVLIEMMMKREDFLREFGCSSKLPASRKAGEGYV